MERREIGVLANPIPIGIAAVFSTLQHFQRECFTSENTVSTGGVVKHAGIVWPQRNSHLCLADRVIPPADLCVVRSEKPTRPHILGYHLQLAFKYHHLYLAESP